LNASNFNQIHRDLFTFFYPLDIFYPISFPKYFQNIFIFVKMIIISRIRLKSVVIVTNVFCNFV